MRAWMALLMVVPAFCVVAGCGPQKTEELPMVDVGEIRSDAFPVEPLPPAPEATETAVEEPVVGTAGTHTVKKGDTLYSLAKRYYGDGKLWPRILDANRDKIKDERSVPLGAVLKIPPK